MLTGTSADLHTKLLKVCLIPEKRYLKKDYLLPHVNIAAQHIFFLNA